MKIFKYQKDDEGRDFGIGIPFLLTTGSSTIAKFGIQSGVFTVWSPMESELQKTTHGLMIVGTGHEYPAAYRHVESIFDRSFVWHLVRKSGDWG